MLSGLINDVFDLLLMPSMLCNALINLLSRQNSHSHLSHSHFPLEYLVFPSISSTRNSSQLS